METHKQRKLQTLHCSFLHMTIMIGKIHSYETGWCNSKTFKRLKNCLGSKCSLLCRVYGLRKSSVSASSKILKFFQQKQVQHDWFLLVFLSGNWEFHSVVGPWLYLPRHQVPELGNNTNHMIRCSTSDKTTPREWQSIFLKPSTRSV